MKQEARFVEARQKYHDHILKLFTLAGSSGGRRTRSEYVDAAWNELHGCVGTLARHAPRCTNGRAGWRVVRS